MKLEPTVSVTPCMVWVRRVFWGPCLNIKAAHHINSQIPLMVYTICTYRCMYEIVMFESLGQRKLLGEHILKQREWCTEERYILRCGAV
jgi:hypothetical protein